MSQKIRIKLKSYDHKLVDKSAEKIVKAVKATGAIVSGPIPLPTYTTTIITPVLLLNNIVKVAQALNVTPSELLTYKSKIELKEEDN